MAAGQPDQSERSWPRDDPRVRIRPGTAGGLVDRDLRWQADGECRVVIGDRRDRQASDGARGDSGLGHDNQPGDSGLGGRHPVRHQCDGVVRRVVGQSRIPRRIDLPSHRRLADLGSGVEVFAHPARRPLQVHIEVRLAECFAVGVVGLHRGAGVDGAVFDLRSGKRFDRGLGSGGGAQRQDLHRRSRARESGNRAAERSIPRRSGRRRRLDRLARNDQRLDRAHSGRQCGSEGRCHRGRRVVRCHGPRESVVATAWQPGSRTECDRHGRLRTRTGLREHSHLRNGRDANPQCRIDLCDRLQRCGHQQPNRSGQRGIATGATRLDRRQSRGGKGIGPHRDRGSIGIRRVRRGNRRRGQQHRRDSGGERLRDHHRHRGPCVAARRFRASGLAVGESRRD